MIIKEINNMYDIPADIYIATTNSYITKDNRLVMGRGAALQMSNMYPQIPYIAANKILIDQMIIRRLDNVINKKNNYNYDCENVTYGFIHFDVYGKSCYSYVGLLQVKYHFKSNADLDLLKFSVDMMENKLKKYFLVEGSRPDDNFDYYDDAKIVMNYPCIGYGNIDEKDVYPIIKHLPDNYIVCKFK